MRMFGGSSDGLSMVAELMGSAGRAGADKCILTSFWETGQWRRPFSGETHAHTFTYAPHIHILTYMHIKEHIHGFMKIHRHSGMYVTVLNHMHMYVNVC